MSKETIEKAQGTVCVLREGVEDVTDLLDYAGKRADDHDEAAFVLMVLRRLRGIRYGLDKLENELLSE